MTCLCVIMIVLNTVNRKGQNYLRAKNNELKNVHLVLPIGPSETSKIFREEVSTVKETNINTHDQQ